MVELEPKCGRLCKKFKTWHCPREDKDSVKYRIYMAEEGDAPLNETCFEPIPQEEEKPDHDHLALIGKLQKGDLLQRTWEHARKRVKEDERGLKVVVLACLSAYSKNPINLFIKGDTSTGKTYVVMEAVKYFPPKDVWVMGSMSPKSLIHLNGVKVDENGFPIDFSKFSKDDEEDKRELARVLSNSKTLIDLRGKILVFLEPPNRQTMEMLKPLLSHDKFETEYIFVDKGERLTTVRVILRGWPAAIFCSARLDYYAELATRGFTLTPEVSSRKIEAAEMLIAEEAMFPASLKADVELLRLCDDFLTLREALRGFDVSIPYADKIVKVFPKTMGRDMRDFKRFIELVKLCSLTSITLAHKLIIDAGGERKMFVIAPQYCFWQARELYANMSETTRLGIPGRAVKVLDAIREAGKIGLPMLAKDILGFVAEQDENLKELSSTHLKKILELLREADIVDSEEYPDDKRKLLYTFSDPIGDRGIIGDKSGNPLILPSVSLEMMKKFALLAIGDNSPEIQGEEAFTLILPDGSTKEGFTEISKYAEGLCSCNVEVCPLFERSSNLTPFSESVDKVKCIPELFPICPQLSCIFAKPKKCQDCEHWESFKCKKHPEWVMVSLIHPICELFEERAKQP